jgi:hypothetical protein
MSNMHEDVKLKFISFFCVTAQKLAGLLISTIAIDSDTIGRYFCSIAIGIADTFMRKYRYRYRRYFFRLYRYRLSAILWSIVVDY